MSHVKLVDADSWERREVDRYSLPIKVSSRGLVGHDRDVFLKAAGLSPLQGEIDKFLAELKPGEEPFYNVGLGATEVVGPNRNGDGFTKRACELYSWTFTKYGRWYRNHKNDDPAQSYGLLKRAIYNPAMGRVEILSVLNATKEAAERNGGLVADLELEQAGRGEDLGSSMACFLDPRTPVLLRERGYRPIAEVGIGDEVWTKEGRWRPVTELRRRVYAGEAVRIELANFPLSLSVTADHLFWAKPSGEQKASWWHAGELSPGDLLFHRPLLQEEEETGSLKPLATEVLDGLARRAADGVAVDLWSALSRAPREQRAEFHDRYRRYRAENTRPLPISLFLQLRDVWASFNSFPSQSGYGLEIHRDGAVAMRVKSIDCQQVREAPTWNVEVAEDESYSAAGLISHNCKVAFDICSGCGNKAKNRHYYCGPDRCSYGGLKTAMGRTFEDGHVLHADNPEPCWFDLSYIPGRQADRIAYSSPLREKRAVDVVKGGAELAEEEGIHFPRWMEKIAHRLSPLGPTLSEEVLWRRDKILRDLARFEKHVLDGSVKLAAGLVPTKPFPVEKLPPSTSPLAAGTLAALASEGILLPPADFARWGLGRDLSAEERFKFAAALSGVHDRLHCSRSLFLRVGGETLDAMRGSPTDEDRLLAIQEKDAFAITSPLVRARSLVQAARGVEFLPQRPLKKSAGDESSPWTLLAEQYALSNLAGLDAMLANRSRGRDEREALCLAAAGRAMAL